MDVDPSPSTSDMSIPSNVAAIALPKIDEDNIMDPQTAKQRVTEILDMLEGRVEKLRREAVALEEDRDNILASLDSIRSADWIADMVHFEQEETHRYLDRIIDRCLTVDIKIHTQRDQPQEEALHQVNHLIDGLVMSLKTDPDGAKEKCVSYMNACSSHHVQGIPDKKFENALLGCTLDDQKRVKKRLQGLLTYFDRLDVTCEDITTFFWSDNTGEKKTSNELCSPKIELFPIVSETRYHAVNFKHVGTQYIGPQSQTFEESTLGPLKRKLEKTISDDGCPNCSRYNEDLKKLRTSNGRFLFDLLDDMNKLSQEEQTKFKSIVLNHLSSKK